ncbi:sushi-like protein [Biomphalaria glabrata]|nr:putative chitinase 10 [Biomphalaria glabrata]
MAALQILSFLLVNVLFVSGQFNPTASRAGCSDPSVQAGHGYFPHEVFCEKYGQCDSGLNRFDRNCGPGSLYSANINVCVKPEQANCTYWERSPTGTKFPAMCCDQYLEKIATGYAFKFCPSGTIFQASSGNCISGVCNDDIGCYRPGKVTVGNNYTCFDIPDENGDPCVYTTQFSGNVIKKRPCPWGTAFNRELCQCSIVTSGCPTASTIANNTANKALDPQCRPSFNLDFNSLPLQVTSDKIVSGTTTTLNYFTQTVGVTVSNGVANLVADPANRDNPYIYSYFFNSNQLASPVAFTITFRCDSFTGVPFQLLTNNYNNDVCPATLDVVVTCSNGRYNVQVSATGATATGAASELQLKGSANGGLGVQNQNNFVDLTIFYDGTISGLISEKNTNNRSPITSTSGNLGTYLATNKCGLVLGRGLTGKIDNFTVREGCQDKTRVIA